MKTPTAAIQASNAISKIEDADPHAQAYWDIGNTPLKQKLRKLPAILEQQEAYARGIFYTLADDKAEIWYGDETTVTSWDVPQKTWFDGADNIVMPTTEK